MPYLLHIVRRSRWPYDEDPPRDTTALPADPLGDLATKDNSLSLWRIEDDKSNLDRIAATLAANRQRLGPFDYILFPSSLLDNEDFELTKSDGGTHDKEVNTRWHMDLIHLSAIKLVDFAKLVYRAGDIERLSPKRVERLLKDHVSSGYLRPASLEKSLQKELGIIGETKP